MINLAGKRVLITGGTGSFGNALIDNFPNEDVNFIVFSRDEKKQHDMFIERTNKNIEYVVGDIRDKDRLITALRDVDYVFHAAALKHVPTGENFPGEVIQTNIIGTKNVVEAAEYCGVKKVVNLSTDKAVYPVNAYGMSKALGEKILSAHRGNTECVSLRYGNVLGSRGSVLPLFLDKIKKELPLTVTDPGMTRYLLTLQDAVSLALKCLQNGSDGDLFVIRSPASTISTLIEALELNAGRKLETRIIGIRPGEKYHETLLTSDEVFRSKIEESNGIIYAKIPKLDATVKDFFVHGEEHTLPEPFTSSNTIQFNAEQTLEKINEANLL